MELHFIETGNRFGNMNTTAFPKRLLPQAEKLFLENRKKAAEFYGFRPLKIYVPTQQRDNSYKVITEDMVESCKDGWDLSILADILIVTDKTPNVVAGYPVADCAVFVASDIKNGVTATAHCSMEFVDRKLPLMTVEALKEKYDSKEENIILYISACAGTSWTYDCHPPFARHESIWEETGALKKEVHAGGEYYRIDLRKAILAQLSCSKFKNVIVNPSDTILDQHFYSNCAFKSGAKEKLGRHFAGVFYKKM